MNEDIKKHLQAALDKGVRLDGRKLDEFRPITIELDVIDNAEGSAKVTCGDTKVIAGVKMGVGKPFPDRQDEGAMMVNAELIPMSNPEFESGPPSINAIESSRVIDRGIRESKCLDQKKLCIKKGEAVWIINIDAYPIQLDGNIIDVGGLAAIAAARRARLPKIKDGIANHKELSKDKLPLTTTPIPVTVFKIGNNFLIDPTQDEEAAADSRLTVTSVDSGKICSLQKGGEGTLTTDDVSKMFDLAVTKGKELRKMLEKVKA